MHRVFCAFLLLTVVSCTTEPVVCTQDEDCLDGTFCTLSPVDRMIRRRQKVSIPIKPSIRTKGSAGGIVCRTKTAEALIAAQTAAYAKTWIMPPIIGSTRQNMSQILCHFAKPSSPTNC